MQRGCGKIFKSWTAGTPAVRTEMNDLPLLSSTPRLRLLLCLLSSVVIILFGNVVQAQRPSSSGSELGAVDTAWQGLRFIIPRIERIQQDRLVVVVLIQATPAAAPSGVLVGIETPIPPGAKKIDIDAGKYGPKPFSLASSVMIDERTLQKFPVLPPVAPPGKEYFPGEFLGRLYPGQTEIMTIQFAAPPAPPSPEGMPPPKQTVSFLLTGAKGAIARVAIPPPAAVSDRADGPRVSVQE
jgi:hypothetical protein